jgi:hypothetical protein
VYDEHALFKNKTMNLLILCPVAAFNGKTKYRTKILMLGHLSGNPLLLI